MPRINFSRRQIAKSLLLLGAGGVSAKYWISFQADDEVIKLPNNNEEESFKIFFALCAMVTLRNDLDAETTKKIYELFIAESWGEQNISRLYNKIMSQLADNKNHKKLDDDEKWFLEHLLTTWYLGVYYHENQQTQRVAHQTALMFSAAKNILPIPFIEATGFGNWSEQPKEIYGR